jgi:hypothetical protein
MKSMKTVYTAHDEVWTLIPWYINGTLAQEESSLVRQHLQVCIACRKELATQQGLSKAIRQAGDIELSPQAAFSRLMKQIDDEPVKAETPTQWWSWVRSQWRKVSEGLSPQLRPRPVFALIPLLLVAGISILLAWNSISVEPHYRTLANPSSLPSAESNDLRVVFAKTMRRDQIDQLLFSIHGRIVDGPSPFGVYTINHDGLNQETSTVVKKLRDHAGVLFVEPSLPRKDLDPPRG